VHLPVSSLATSAFPKSPWVGFPQLSVQRLPNGVVFRGCSHSFIFRPPGLLPPRSFPPQCLLCTGQLWRLPPSISRFVTSPRIGYTSRPNRATDGGGLSPPRFAALTAAPGTDHDNDVLIEQRRFEKWPRPSVGIPPGLVPPAGPAWPLKSRTAPRLVPVRRRPDIPHHLWIQVGYEQCPVVVIRHNEFQCDPFSALLR
jgi:hypothetical protein